MNHEIKKVKRKTEKYEASRLALAEENSKLVLTKTSLIF